MPPSALLYHRRIFVLAGLPCFEPPYYPAVFVYDNAQGRRLVCRKKNAPNKRSKSEKAETFDVVR